LPHVRSDAWIAQLDWKRVPQVRSSTCKSSVAITAMDVFNKIIGREQYMLGLQRFVTP